jgi:hypothetical protein
MVMNPLSPSNREHISQLISRCEELKAYANEDSQVKIDDISTNLTAYLDSDIGVWPQYRLTVPFDFIHREFRQRLNTLESENPSDIFSKSYLRLESDGFNPEMLFQNNAVRFIGNPKKAAEVMKKHFGTEALPMIKTDNGGILVRLGSRFEGKDMIEESDFKQVFSETMASEPAVSKWFGDLIQSAHTFATEDIIEFGGIPTKTDGEAASPTPSPSPSPPAPSPPTRQTDGNSFPAELLRLIESTKKLWPEKTKDSISEQLILLDLRPPPPDPPPSPPVCKPLWSEIPPDPRMTRIDAYNMVDSGRPSAPDGFGWSVSGLSESNAEDTFRQTQLVTWPRFHIISGQKGVRRIITEPQPEGWVVNETKPQKCSLFKQGFLLRIPSLSAEATVVGYNIRSSNPDTPIPEKVRFFKDSADGLYMEIQDYNSGQHSECAFTVTQAAPPYSTYSGDLAAGKLFSCGLTFADYKAGKGKQYGNYESENVILQGSGISDADKVLENQQISIEMPIGEVIQQLYSWLYDWFCENIPRNQSDMIGAYLKTNAGACRHRAYIMFLALNRLGLPCRMVGSTCHAWSEIWNPDTGSWMELDLNGCDDSPPPADCPPCMTKNPFYNIMRDEELLRCCPEGYRMEGDKCVAIDGSGDTVDSIECEECLPRICPDGYDCNPFLDKCVPDCAKLYGAGWHYHAERDECVNCDNEGSNLEWDGQECVCKKCPDEYEMDEDENCVDENGLISGDAPKGLYFDKNLNECWPKKDCSKKEGTRFNIVTGECECPPLRTQKGGEIILTLRRWSADTGKCEVERECESHQEVVYDPVLGDYVCKDRETENDPDFNPDFDPDFDPTIPIEEDKEDREIEGIKIDKDAKGIPKTPGVRYVNTKSGAWINSKPSDMKGWIKIDKQDLQLKGRDSNNKRYDSVWKFGDLYGVSEWLDSQSDLDLISYRKPVENGGYFMVFSVNPDDSNADAHWNLWKQSIGAVRGGLGKVDDGDSIKWKRLPKSENGFPAEWGLKYDDGEVWMLTQVE